MGFGVASLILPVIYLLTFTGSAQNNYVVLAKGDTLYGNVRFLRFGNDQKIQLTDLSRKKTIYEGNQIKAVGHEEHTFHTLRTAEGYAIMKLIKAGYLSLYAFQMENQSTWDGQYLYKRDGSGLEVSTLLFKKRLIAFLSECPEVTAKLETKELARNDLEEIVNQFNTCIEQRTIAAQQQAAKTSKLDELEKAVLAFQASEDRTIALEIIAEIKSKIQRNEPIPAFLSKSLLNALTNHPSLTALAYEALR